MEEIEGEKAVWTRYNTITHLLQHLIPTPYLPNHPPNFNKQHLIRTASFSTIHPPIHLPYRSLSSSM